MSRARDTANQINRVNSSAADATAITVDSSENVGIGTATPSGKLELYGSGISDLPLVINHAWGSSSTALISASAASSEVFKVERNGDLTLSGGIHLGGTGSANKLDDAEYGVWNPANSQITLASTNGNYVKVGRMCTVAFRLVWPTNSNTAQARISLPFACASHGSAAHMAGLAIAFTTYTNTPSGGVYSGGTFMEFFKTGQTQLTNADLSGKQINGSVTYITNS